MLNEELKTKLTELFPAATFEEGGEWINMVVPAADWTTIARQLKTEASLLFDYMFCLTCIDWAGTAAGKTKMTMVYHLRSTRHLHCLVIKINLDRSKPEVESVSDIWRTAEFHEREVYEMFGVQFLHHPDLRLLILPDGWEGKNPLRKDFEDPVNMIKL